MEVNSVFKINNEEVELFGEKDTFKFYRNNDGDCVYLVQYDKVIAEIGADCNQNFGFISEVKFHIK